MSFLTLKVPPLLLMAIFAGLMWLLVPWLPGVVINTTLKYLLVVFCIGSGGWFAGAGVLAFRQHQTTVDPRFPEHASRLVDSGIYRVSRNPMYVGFAFWLVGWVIYWQSPVLVLGVAGFIVYMNRFQIVPEEQALVAQFGESYREYSVRVRRWL